eukprot:3685681-Amphidinium_carterae.1
MLASDMDDEAWLREQDKKVARERAAKANAMLSDLDRKPDAGRSGAGNSSSSAYVPPSWETQEANQRQRKGDDVETPLCGLNFSPPSERSFETFFKQWFSDEQFPIMSELLKKELVFRAKQKGFISGLSS